MEPFSCLIEKGEKESKQLPECQLAGLGTVQVVEPFCLPEAAAFREQLVSWPLALTSTSGVLCFLYSGVQGVQGLLELAPSRTGCSSISDT